MNMNVKLGENQFALWMSGNVKKQFYLETI